MSYIGSTEWYQKVQAGEVAGHSIVHKFGYADIGTTIAPVSLSGFYRMPTAVEALEIVSDDADDASAGTGARTVTVVGLNSAWAEVEQTVTLNGTTPVALSTDLVRLYRMWVTDCGFYGGSNEGTITVQETGAGQAWAQIGVSPTAHGQSLIACYTVPTGKTAYILGVNVGVDASKSVDLVIQRRQSADDVTVPYSAFRTIFYEVGIQGEFTLIPVSPTSPFPGPTDIVCQAKVATGSAAISIDFELLLVDD